MSAALDRTLAALADPTRRQVVDLLRQGPRAAGDLAAATGVSAPVMSRHLKVLRESGLVSDAHPEFDARVRIYALRREQIATVRTWLQAVEDLWVDELAAFKAHVEKGRRD